MPTYNHRAYVVEAIKGVMSQEVDVPVTLLILDDASTDGTGDLAKEAQGKWPKRIVVTRNVENRHSLGFSPGAQLLQIADKLLRKRSKFLEFLGFNSRRNIYIAYCEGDDVWTSESKLQTQINFFRENPSVTLTFHSFGLILEPGGDREHLEALRRHNRATHSEELISYSASQFFQGNPVKTCTAVYRRSSLSLKEMENRPTGVLGDWASSALAAAQGSAVFLPWQFANYRVHPGGVWSNASEEERERRIRVTLNYLHSRINKPV